MKSTLTAILIAYATFFVSTGFANEAKRRHIPSDNKFGDIESLCTEQSPGAFLCTFQFTNATAGNVNRIIFTVKGEPSYTCPYAEYEITIRNIAGLGGSQSGPDQPVEFCTTDIDKITAQVLSVSLGSVAH